jgi:hypothetical protein
MAVHKEGALKPVAGDLQTTHRGANIALKMIAWGGAMPVLCLIEQKGSVWETFAIIYEFGDRMDGKPGFAHEAEIEQMGSIGAWIRQVILPAINAALADRFRPNGDVIDVPATGDAIADIDAAIIATLRWLPQADGALQVGSR